MVPRWLNAVMRSSRYPLLAFLVVMLGVLAAGTYSPFVRRTTFSIRPGDFLTRTIDPFNSLLWWDFMAREQLSIQRAPPRSVSPLDLDPG